MQIHYNLTSNQRKALVNAAAEVTGLTSKYLGAPSFYYTVGPFTIDRSGCLNIPESLGEDTKRTLVEGLAGRGFTGESDMELETQAPAPQSEIISNATENGDRITPIRPMDGLTATALDNLKRLIASKDTLIRKSLSADSLPIRVEHTRILFPDWLPKTEDLDELSAYNALIDALLTMAKTQKRVTAIERPVENEKYAFRCFLLRLGFIGDDYKSARKLLLANLSGNGAFKGNPERLSEALADERLVQEVNDPSVADAELAEALADEQLLQDLDALLNEGSDD